MSFKVEASRQLNCYHVFTEVIYGFAIEGLGLLIKISTPPTHPPYRPIFAFFYSTML